MAMTVLTTVEVYRGSGGNSVLSATITMTRSEDGVTDGTESLCFVSVSSWSTSTVTGVSRMATFECNHCFLRLGCVAANHLGTPLTDISGSVESALLLVPPFSLPLCFFRLGGDSGHEGSTPPSTR